MNDATPPAGELFVTQFLVVSDQDRPRDFDRSVFGAEVLRARDPVILALANTRIVLNLGGGPTDDKPTVRLAPQLSAAHDVLLHLARVVEVEPLGRLFITNDLASATGRPWSQQRQVSDPRSAPATEQPTAVRRAP